MIIAFQAVTMFTIIYFISMGWCYIAERLFKDRHSFAEDCLISLFLSVVIMAGFLIATNT